LVATYLTRETADAFYYDTAKVVILGSDGVIQTEITLGEPEDATGFRLSPQDAQVAALPNGNFVVVWSAEDLAYNGGGQILARVYAPDGSLVNDTVTLSAECCSQPRPRFFNRGRVLSPAREYSIHWANEATSPMRMPTATIAMRWMSRSQMAMEERRPEPSLSI